MPGHDSDRVVTATVLFADLAGSTTQRVTLGDDAADELNAACNQLLRDAVATHGGRVVKDTGDGVMAVFSAASDAVGAAVAIHQAAYRHNHDVDAADELSIRIGCSAGDLQLVGGDCLGIPVVEAARLEADATPGEIWVSDLVRSLVGSRGTCSFESLGELELKGLAGPVTAHRVPWEPLTEVPASPRVPVGTSAPEAWDVPLPRRLERASVFVGREREQAVLEGALTAVRVEGRRHAVLIGGEPGIGKTALTAWIAQVAHDDGAVVLYGRCDEDLGIPYQPWTEALAHLVRHTPEATLAAHVDARGRALARLVPELNGGVSASPHGASDPEAERYLVFGAVVDLLERALEDRDSGAGLGRPALGRPPVAAAAASRGWGRRRSAVARPGDVPRHRGCRRRSARGDARFLAP